jgi:hypothetical protein
MIGLDEQHLIQVESSSIESMSRAGHWFHFSVRSPVNVQLRADACCSNAARVSAEPAPNAVVNRRMAEKIPVVHVGKYLLMGLTKCQAHFRIRVET